MRKFQKAIIPVIVLSVLLGGTVFAANKTIDVTTGVNIFVNDTKLDPKDATGKPVEPFIYSGTTYLPVRAVAETLKLEVGWEGGTQTVSLSGQPSKSHDDWVGVYKEQYNGYLGELMLPKVENKKLTVTTGVKIKFNGNLINPIDESGKKVEIIVYNGTTYLPVRAISETVGMEVNWDGSSRTVFLGDYTPVRTETPKPEPEPEPKQDRSKWVGKYTEIYSFQYGDKLPTSECVSKGAEPYLNLKEDGTFTYLLNLYYATTALEGTWEIDQYNTNKVNVKFNKNEVTKDVSFIKTSDNELTLSTKDYIHYSNEMSTSALGNIYRK